MTIFGCVTMRLFTNKPCYVAKIANEAANINAMARREQQKLEILIKFCSSRHSDDVLQRCYHHFFISAVFDVS